MSYSIPLSGMEMMKVWLDKVEKYSSDGNTRELIKSLCSVCALLRVETFSPEMQMNIVSRLKPLLLHENTNVLRNAMSVIIVLAEESTLPSEITMELMKQAENMLFSCGDKLTLVCEMLAHLTNENTTGTQMLCSSGCLRSILTIYGNIDLLETPMDKINWLVNVIICAISDETRMMIGEEVIPKVVRFLNTWLNIDDPDAAMTAALTELLFLCRCVISCFKEGQNMFIQCGGLQSLIRALNKNDVMEKHLIMVTKQTRNCLHLDYSPTLFSSLVILMDVAVTHNSKASQLAVDLDAIRILNHYLNISPKEQKLFLVDTIVHILEADESISPSSVNKMCHMIKKRGCTDDSRIYLQSKQNAVQSPRRKGTPHPRKGLKKPLKRLEKSASERNTKTLNPSSSEIFQATHALQSNLSPESNCLQVSLPEAQSTTRYVFSHADLLLLVLCVQVHGVNMDNIRRAYPVHPELTPAELYRLWRALWPKKH